MFPIRKTAVVFIIPVLAACGSRSGGSEVNLFENTAIFSLFSLAAFGFIAIFLTGLKNDKKAPPAKKRIVLKQFFRDRGGNRASSTWPIGPVTRYASRAEQLAGEAIRGQRLTGKQQAQLRRFSHERDRQITHHDRGGSTVLRQVWIAGIG
jgi:hypothetical protein